MPVTGTPTSSPNPTNLPGYVQPAVTVLDDTPLVQREQNVCIKDGRTKTLVWTMKTAAGIPIDLTPYVANNPAASLRVAEYASPGCVTYDFPGTILNASIGQVQAVVDVSNLNGPGIFQAEFRVLNSDGSIATSNAFLLTVERSLFGAQLSGPPSFAEIRLFMRDSAPAENRLLDEVSFDDAELAAAINMPVLYWNEALPPVAPMTTQSFPFRYNWIQATIGQLLLISTEWYRKNRLAYSAGGTTVDDMDKAQLCEQAGLRRWQEYKDWVKQKKIQINIESGFGTLGSPYRFHSWGGNWQW